MRVTWLAGRRGGWGACRRVVAMAVLGGLVLAGALAGAAVPASSAAAHQSCATIFSGAWVRKDVGIGVGAPQGDLGGRVVYPATIAFWQRVNGGNVGSSPPGSYCFYDYASKAVSGYESNPFVVQVTVAYGPFTATEWSKHAAWERINAYAGTTGKTTEKPLNLGHGSKAFETTLSGYYQNGSPPPAYFKQHNVYVLTRSGNYVAIGVTAALAVPGAGTYKQTTVAMETSLAEEVLSHDSAYF
jgi:hypothetical protein